MAGAREPYLVQVNSIERHNDTPIVRKVWLNIYYITGIYEARKTDMLYKDGARWYAVLTDAVIWVDDNDCEKITTNINGSY